MTEPRSAGYKTLAIQLTDEQHAQLVLIAQVEGGLSLKDLLKQAVVELIERKRGESDFASRAAGALEEIDREAAARRQAIQSLFGTTAATDPEPAAPEAPGRRTSRRGGEPTA
jgi:predicted CopG family antitoxin